MAQRRSPWLQNLPGEAGKSEDDSPLKITSASTDMASPSRAHGATDFSAEANSPPETTSGKEEAEAVPNKNANFNAEGASPLRARAPDFVPRLSTAAAGPMGAFTSSLHATPSLRGCCSTTANMAAADTNDAGMASGKRQADTDASAIPGLYEGRMDPLPTRVIVGWPDGGLNKVKGLKAGWGYTLCDLVLVDGEFVMELLQDGCGPVIEKHHPEWMQKYFVGSTDQSPGQAEFCGTIEMLKAMHGIATAHPDQRFSFTGRPDSRNVIDTLCCNKVSSNRLLFNQALADRDALVSLENVDKDNFNLYHSKAHLSGGKFKCPFNHRADRNAAQGAMGRIHPSGRWANVVAELAEYNKDMDTTEEVLLQAKSAREKTVLGAGVARVDEAAIYVAGHGEEGTDTGYSFRVVAMSQDVEETGVDLAVLGSLTGRTRGMKAAASAACKGLDALKSILVGSPCDLVRIFVLNKITQTAVKRAIDVRAIASAWDAGTVIEVVIGKVLHKRKIEDPLLMYVCERARMASKGRHVLLSPTEAAAHAKGVLSLAELGPFPLNCALTPLPPQPPRVNEKCQHEGCEFLYTEGGLAQMQAHMNRAHRSDTCSAPYHTKYLLGNLCHLGCGYRLPSGSVGGAAMTKHLQSCPGAVRIVDPILFEEEGGELCQIAASGDATSRLTTDFLKYSLFSDVPLESVTYWDGEIARYLPRALKPYFTSQTEELARDYLNSPLGDLRLSVANADRMYQRLVFRNAGRGQSAINTLCRRVDDWECGRWGKLMEELAVYDATRVAIRKKTAVRRTPRQRSATVQRECEDGNFRKGMQALVDATKFHGKWEEITALYPDLVETLETITPGAAVPEMSTDSYFKALCGMTKSTAPSADGTSMDLFIQANEAPSADPLDSAEKLQPFASRAELAVKLGSGQLKFGSEGDDAVMYQSYSALLLNVVEKSNTKRSPRPTGSQHTLPKIGVSMLFAASYAKLRKVMISICNLVMGCSGSADVVAWFLQLSWEEGEGECGIMALDASNAFNAMSRCEIQYCLKRFLDPGLGWVEFMFWRWNSVLTEVIWAHPITGVTHRLFSGTGITQGGLMSSFLYAIGQARVLSLLKDEFKEKLVSVVYADDCTFTYKVGDSVLVSDHPQLAPLVNNGQTRMPLPMAIFYRLRSLAKKFMNVDFNIEGNDHKQVCMQDTWDGVDTGLYGNMKLKTGGIKVNGNPVGSDAFRTQYLRDFVTTDFAAYYCNLAHVDSYQTRHLLELNTGGALRLNHLMRAQPNRLWRNEEGLAEGEQSAYVMVNRIMMFHARLAQNEPREVTERVWEQMGLQLNMAGSGITHLTPEAMDSCLSGGWDSFRGGVEEWMPMGHFTRSLDEDTSVLPAMRDLRNIYRSQVTASPCLSKILSLAAGQQMLPPSEDDEDDSPVSRYKAMMKSIHDSWGEHMLGCYEEPEFKPFYLKWEMEADIIISQMTSSREFSAPVLDSIRHPENYPSILRKWSKQGGVKAQSLFSKFANRRRFLSFYMNRLNTGHARAIYRSNMGEFSPAFLTTVPRCPAFRYTNDEFMWSYRSRFWTHQPLVSACRKLKCSCGGRVNEEHVITCNHDPFRNRSHFALQLCAFGMLKHAGILATLEPKHLVLQQGQRRQADVMGHGCRLHPGSDYTEIGIDVGLTFPMHSTGPSERYVGKAAREYAQKKRGFRDTEKTLKKRGMKYFPAIVECNGVPGKSIAVLIKQVATIAKDQRGHNPSYFKRYWTLMWANTVTKSIARAGLAKCRKILTKSSSAGMPFYVESGAFLSPACEGPLVGRTI